MVQERLRARQDRQIYSFLSDFQQSPVSAVATVGQELLPHVTTPDNTDGTLVIGPRATFQTFSMPTAFELVLIGQDYDEAEPQTANSKLFGAMAYNPDLMGDNKVKADLVRTAHIAWQYTKGGFSKNMRGIYGDALEAQQSWLESTRHTQIPFDPRYTDREELLRQLLGDPIYFTDFSFADWQQAANMFRSKIDGSNELLLGKIDALATHQAPFVFVRAAFDIPLLYEQATTDIVNFRDLKPPQRATICASAVMDKILKDEVVIPS